MGIPELIALTVVSTGASIYSQSKAASAASKATSAQRRQEALAAAIQRRNSIKAGLASQAAAIQAGENQGVAGPGSSAVGAANAITTQMNANLSFLDQQGQLADYAGKMFDRSNRWSQTATIFGGVARLAEAGAGYASADKAAKEQAALLKKYGIE